MTDIYREEFRIRLSETDCNGVLKAEALFNYFQDTGSEHAATLGISADNLLVNNYTWVMLKYNISIFRHPVWNEEIIITSWRYPHKNLYDLRMFVISDRQGTELVRGKSAWVIMGCETRRPVRLSRCIPEHLMQNKNIITDDFHKISSLTDAEHTRPLKIRRSDLDFNNHVNNAIYVGWALESMPDHIQSEYRLKQIEVNYISEATYGNKVNAAMAPIEGSTAFLHAITGGEDNRELARLKTTWEKI